MSINAFQQNKKLTYIQDGFECEKLSSIHLIFFVSFWMLLYVKMNGKRFAFLIILHLSKLIKTAQL